MITGDHAVTAEAIARKLGIEGRAITGAEFAAMSDDEALAQIDEIGVIARVTPEDKVRLVDTLKRSGHVVAMTGDGVNDAPALKRADIGIAMGITGTEVSKEAAAMILTDDNFATIVKAVEHRPRPLRQPDEVHPFQMGVLIGFIVTFLGASIFNVVGGVPFVPLQTLWVNFTTQVVPGGRARLRQARRRPDGAQAAAARRADPDRAPLLSGSRRRPRARRRDARRHRVGGRRTTAPTVARTMGMTTFAIAQRLLLVHASRTSGARSSPRDVRRPAAADGDRRLGASRSCSAPSCGSSSASSARSA